MMAQFKRDRLNVYVHGETINIWRRVVSELDLVAKSGTQKGQGSVSALLEAIAAPGFDFARLEGLFREAVEAVAGRVSELADG